MYYFIGDIHGYLDELISLFKTILPDVTPEDRIVFLGDYIDRGENSFEVIEYLLALSRKYTTTFLKGNHEDMFLNYLDGEDDRGLFLINGGVTTVQSYKEHMGSMKLPESHVNFFSSLESYLEGEDFIAVHAGLDPESEPDEQYTHDLMWIREEFFRSDHRWSKTVIFGHTPTPLLSGEKKIFHDTKRNIIAIDTGVISGGPISCLRWPDCKEYYSSR